jgi:hypothetical integral membrane protein (TIGR02206 family)
MATDHSTFHLFGAAHLTTIALIAAVSVLLPLVARASRGQRMVRPMAIGLAVVLLTQDIGKLAYKSMVLDTPWVENLPFHLCDIALIVGAIALLRTDRRLFQLLYYWGLAGTLQAILTPDLPVGFPDPRYIVFFFSHGLVIITIAFGIGALGMRPTFRGIGLTLIATHLWALGVAAPANYLFSTNYLYLCAKPAQASMIDAFGPWPWYLVMLDLVGLLSFLAYYMPWAVVRLLEERRLVARRTRVAEGV